MVVVKSLFCIMGTRKTWTARLSRLSMEVNSMKSKIAVLIFHVVSSFCRKPVMLQEKNVGVFLRCSVDFQIFFFHFSVFIMAGNTQCLMYLERARKIGIIVFIMFL